MSAIHSAQFGSLCVTTVVTGRWAQNSYVLTDRSANASAIIDPGGEVESVLAEVGGAHVEAILCTHGHYDHLGAAAAISRLTGARCWVHQRDFDLARRAPLYGFAFERRGVDPPENLCAFSDDAAFTVGLARIEVISTPGHTPGSVTFMTGSLLFTGDTLLREAVGRTDLPGGDLPALRRSVERLLLGDSDHLVLLPGHGRPWTTGEARGWWRRPGAEGSA